MIQLENNYCEIEDVLAYCGLTSINPSESDLVRSSINTASRLIDDYCNTKFFIQDFSINPFDTRFETGLVRNGVCLYLPYPIGFISEIIEDDILLSVNDYYKPSSSIARLYRLDGFNNVSTKWGSVIKIKAKFGYKNSSSCETGYLDLPFVIKKQCAVFASYLSGLKVLESLNNEKTKSSSETGNRIQSLSQPRSYPESWIEKTTGQAEVKPELYTANLLFNTTPNTIETTSNALGYKVPIERIISSTEIDLTSVKNVIPSKEFRVLDAYKFLSI
jgi:hypothetical protein